MVLAPNGIAPGRAAPSVDGRRRFGLPWPAVSLDAITSRIRQDAGADFAFILTRKGRLLTREAPPQMPEIGRTACVAAANEAIEAGASVAERTMPREHLVPFGGAAPVDVFVSPCGEAVVCVVLATWADASAVGPALDAHLPALAELLAEAKAQRSGRARTGRTVAPPAPPPPPDAIPPARATPLPQSRPNRPPRERAASRPSRAGRPPASLAGREDSATGRPPASRGTGRPSSRPRPLAGLVELSKGGVRASDRMQRGPTIAERTATPRPATTPRADSSAGPSRGAARLPFPSEVPRGGGGSLPHIDVGTAPLGRETIAAIEADGHARGSLPHIEVHDAMLGRETLAAIDADHDAMRALTRAPSIEVAAIEIGEAELGHESLAALEDEARLVTGHGDRSTQPWTEPRGDAARAAPAGALGRVRKNSGVDLFREALGELLGDDAAGDDSKNR
jgi:hypothetical protein